MLHLILALVATTSAHAAGKELTFGPEFTFTNKAITDDYWAARSNPQVINDAVTDLGRSISKACTQRKATALDFCEVTQIGDASDLPVFEVEYPNVKTKAGPLKITIGQDPAVVETQVSPMTLKEWRANSKIVQRDLFDIAAENKLLPHAAEGGGHVNIGYKYFKDNPDLFVAFNADVATHPELAMGGYGTLDLEDAVPMAMLDRKTKQEFIKLVNDYYAHNITAEQFTSAVNERIYKYNVFKGSNSPKYNTLNLQSVENANVPMDAKRIEFRPVSGQASANEFVQDIELIDARVHYLEKQLRYGNRPALTEALFVADPKQAQDLANRFRGFVEETGLDWSKYRERARAQWGSAVDVAKAPLGTKGGCKPASVFTSIAKGL